MEPGHRVLRNAVFFCPVFFAWCFLRGVFCGVVFDGVLLRVSLRSIIGGGDRSERRVASSEQFRPPCFLMVFRGRGRLGRSPVWAQPVDQSRTSLVPIRWSSSTRVSVVIKVALRSPIQCCPRPQSAKLHRSDLSTRTDLRCGEGFHRK